MTHQPSSHVSFNRYPIPSFNLKASWQRFALCIGGLVYREMVEAKHTGFLIWNVVPNVFDTFSSPLFAQTYAFVFHSHTLILSQKWCYC